MEAATTRARMLTGRYTCGSSAWRRDTDSKCLLCKNEDSISHILTACPQIKPHLVTKMSLLQELYSQENLTPPGSPEEITSAVLNGDRYLSRSGHIVRFHPRNALLKTRAHCLASSICQKAHIARDIKINAVLTNDLDVTVAYDDFALNDIEDTLPYEFNEDMNYTRY